MNPVEAYKPLGVISIAITWVGLLFMVYKWRGNKSMSYSNHAASANAAHIFYGLLFSTTLPLFYLFISKWFVPSLRLPSLFTYLILIGCVSQIIAAWVPSRDRNKQLIHNIAAYIMHTLLLPSVLIIIILGTAPTFVKVLAVSAEIYMLCVWLVFALFKSSKKHTLYLQTSYVTMFHITILMCTYVR